MSRRSGRRIIFALTLLAGACATSIVGVAATAPSTAAADVSGPVVYVTGDAFGGSLVPIEASSGQVDSGISPVFDGASFAIAPDGLTAYMVADGIGSIVPVDLAARTVAAPIHRIHLPYPAGTTDFTNHRIAITPDGRTAYVTSDVSNVVIPVDLATETPGPPIHVGRGNFVPGSYFLAVAITPDGKTAYVTHEFDGSVTPISTATNKAGKSIKITGGPRSLAITPDGKTVFVANIAGHTVIPISTATNKAGTPINVSPSPNDIAISPDGKTAYAVSFGQHSMVPISTATKKAGAGIALGTEKGPHSIAITPDGKTAYVTNEYSGSVTPVSLTTKKAGKVIKVSDFVGNTVAISPDEAPVAQLSVTPAPAGSAVPTTFDASGSVGPSSPIVSYKWVFGDGQTVTTKTPTVSHSYHSANTYAASVTETDAVGTSTKQVFTGNTVSRNGGASAVATANVVIISCASTGTCSGGVSVPETPNAPAHTINFRGVPTAAKAAVHLSVAPESVVCVNEDPSVAPVADLTDTGFASTTPITITTTLHNTIRADVHQVCYESDIPFLSQTNPTVPTAGTALLLDCAGTANVPPCLVSTKQVGTDVVATFLVPGGDPKFRVVAPAKLRARLPVFPIGTRGTAFTAHFNTTGGRAPITWKLVSGNLPPGLTLAAATGVVSGTPSTAGDYTFALQAGDSLRPPQTAKITATITIK